MVPSMLDTQVSETTLVRSLISSSMLERSSRPSSVRPNHRSVAPVRSVSSCHGTMLEWCSISVMTTSSPGPTRRSPSAHAKVLARRFRASVMFLVNTTPSRSGAPMKVATLSRAASKASVDSAPRVCIARAMLALWRSRWSTIVSMTTWGFWLVFAESR